MVLIIQDYCASESRKFGCTDDQYKSGIALAKRAYKSLDGIDARIIAVTDNTEYRPWWRIKPVNVPSSSVRTIIEITEIDALVHCVIPRGSKTYDEIEKLWKKHRSKPESTEDDE